MKRRIIMSNAIYHIISLSYACAKVFFSLQTSSIIFFLQILALFTIFAYICELTHHNIENLKKSIFICSFNILGFILFVSPYFPMNNIVSNSFIIGIYIGIAAAVTITECKLLESSNKKIKNKKFGELYKYNYKFFQNEKHEDEYERIINSSMVYIGFTYALFFIAFLSSFALRRKGVDTSVIVILIFVFFLSIDMNVKKCKMYSKVSNSKRKMLVLDVAGYIMAVCLLVVSELFIYNGLYIINFFEYLIVTIMCIPMSLENKIITEEYKRLQEDA